MMLMHRMMTNASPDKKRPMAAIFVALLAVGLVVFGWGSL